MSSSDLARIGLSDFFNEHAGISGKPVDWKRTAKIKTDDGDYVRRFENAKAGIVALIGDEALDEYEGEGDYLYCHEAGELYVMIHESPEEEMARFSLMFVSKTQYDREGYFPDQHWGHILKAGYDIPDDLIEDEVMENTFVPADRYQQGTKDELIAALNALDNVTYKERKSE